MKRQMLLEVRAAVALGAAFVLNVGAVAECAEAQWVLQETGTRESLRGLSVAGDKVIWASGNRGTFVRSIDGGATWKADTVPGATLLDFRDVHGFGEDTAVLLSAGQDDVHIYRTTDGGRSWSLTYSNQNPGVFFDGMAFWDSRNGIAFSDPVGGRFFAIRTSDGGATWREIARASMPLALEGEAGFAASGTGIAVAGRSHVWIGTGNGPRTRVLYSTDRGVRWRVSDVPMANGSASGIFSIAFADTLRGVAVGGNYEQATSSAGNIAITTDGGRTWSAGISQPPRGYRSGVAILPDTPGPTLIAVGTSGTDISEDGGRSWKPLSDDALNAVAATPTAVWAAGGGGRIVKLERR